MTIPFRRDETNYVYLSNTLGEQNTVVSLSGEDLVAFERLRGSIVEESGLVTRRLSDGAYGILIEAVEVAHDEMDEDILKEALERTEGMSLNGALCDGETPPKLDDVVAELRLQAERIETDFPDVDLEVAVDDAAFDGMAVIRGFVAEGADSFSKLQDVSEAMLNINDRLREPAAPAPALG